MSRRAFYSISDEILSRFNTMVPPSKRSRIVEHLIERHVSEQEDEITRAALLIENDPGYIAIKDVSADADAWAFETFKRLEAHE